MNHQPLHSTYRTSLTNQNILNERLSAAFEMVFALIENENDKSNARTRN